MEAMEIIELREELGSLRLEKERMEIKFGKIVSDHSFRYQELKDELDQTVKDKARLQEELDLKTKEVEQLFLNIQGLENMNQEDLLELRQAKSAVLDAFSARVSELVKNTRRIIEGGEDENVRCSEGGEDDAGESVGWVRSVGGDDEMGNVIQVMTWPLEEELKAIEAAAFVRRSERGWGVGNSEESEW